MEETKLIQMYALVAQMEAIKANIEMMKAANSANDPRYPQYADYNFQTKEQELTDISLQFSSLL